VPSIVLSRGFILELKSAHNKVPLTSEFSVLSSLFWYLTGNPNVGQANSVSSYPSYYQSSIGVRWLNVEIWLYTLQIHIVYIFRPSVASVIHNS